MIHSRPGYAPRRSDSTPAKLNDDMKPALMRKELSTASTLDLKIAAAMAKQAEKIKYAGPEVLVNPAPTEPPQVLEPGK